MAGGIQRCRPGVAHWTVPYRPFQTRLPKGSYPPVTDGPLIVQSDKTLLLEVDHPAAAEARAAIAPFAELERSPEHVHTYRLTPLGLWNARASGHDAEQVVDALVRFSRYAARSGRWVEWAATMNRKGRRQLASHPGPGRAWCRWTALCS